VKRGLGTLAAVAVLAATVASAHAVAPSVTISLAATGAASAEPVFAVPDIVTVVNRGSELAADVIAKTITAAQASYGTWAISRGASVSMHSVRRGASYVQQAAAEFNYPMIVTAMPTSAIAQLMGRDLAGVLSAGAVVMGRTSADLRGAQVGDVVDMVSAQGPIVSFAVGRIVDDDVIGGTEILMNTDQADSIGVTIETRIVVWGFRSRELLEQQLIAGGLSAKPEVRIRHSWDPRDPDSGLNTAIVKSLLGEFSYRLEPNGVDVTLNSAWVAAHMPPAREVLIDAIPIRARCNLTIRSDLRAALTEVAAAGLAGAIDVDNANLAGGCYYPRFSRLAGTLGFLSRHSWGAALDTNTLANAQGAVPTMNCDVVRIFRKHNFAWGGNFLTSDGMHFEWVGSPRDQFQFPSKYCPNLPLKPSDAPALGDATTGTSLGTTTDVPIGLTTMLVDDDR